MKLLTVQEYNQQVKQFYPQDWALCGKSKGFLYVTDDFKFGAWGITEQSAQNKFKRLGALETYGVSKH